LLDNTESVDPPRKITLFSLPIGELKESKEIEREK